MKKIRIASFSAIGLIAIIVTFGVISMIQSCAPENANKAALVAVDTVVPPAAAEPYRWPSKTYRAEDFGLVPGVIVRWIPRELGEYTEFPVVFVHIEQADGTTKAMRADWNIWTNLNTGDTLR